jgi:hypothetical protein
MNNILIFLRISFNIETYDLLTIRGPIGHCDISRDHWYNPDNSWRCFYPTKAQATGSNYHVNELSIIV